MCRLDTPRRAKTRMCPNLNCVDTWVGGERRVEVDIIFPGSNIRVTSSVF